MAVEVRVKEGAVEFGVRVKTRDSRPGVRGEHGGRLGVRVRSAPEGGKANRELMALIARALGARKSEVRIVSGRTSRDKLVRVTCAEPARLAASVASLGGE